MEIVQSSNDKKCKTFMFYKLLKFFNLFESQYEMIALFELFFFSLEFKHYNSRQFSDCRNKSQKYKTTVDNNEVIQCAKNTRAFL